MPRVTSRSGVTVRSAADEDVSALRALVEELLDVRARPTRPYLREAGAVAERLPKLVADPEVEVLVAEADAGPVGMAVLTTSPLSSLTELSTVKMDFAVVARPARRQGVGRALVAAAAAYAERRGIESIAVAVMPTDRDANRFYARLGFAPVLVRRITTVPALRRKLAAPEQRPVVEDLARRRLLRRPGRPQRVARGAADG